MCVVSRVRQENAHASAVRGLQVQIVLPRFVEMRAPAHAAGSVTGGHQHQQQQQQQLAQVWTLGHDQRVCRWLLVLQQAGAAGKAEPGLLLLQQEISWQTEVPEPSALSVLCEVGKGGAALMSPYVGHSDVPAAGGGAFVVVGGRGLQLAAAAL